MECPLNFVALESATSPSTSLAEFYRFAFLLTGNAATAGHVLIGALTETQAHRAKLGSRGKCHAWFLAAIRRQCLERPHPPEIEPVNDTSGQLEGGSGADADAAVQADPVIRRIHALVEPERSAVALFYLDLCGPGEIAELLGMSIEQFSETLRSGRAHLQEASGAARIAESSV